jgi:hypothetical protein
VQLCVRGFASSASKNEKTTTSLDFPTCPLDFVTIFSTLLSRAHPWDFGCSRDFGKLNL